ncbi:site-specific DNA-methyltransferase [Intestinibacter sp.]|uniref:site-specific DNA-methyltransferase n=1 Tax=Intestinibacter sp. TaxID=1965304 RepID=UPI003AB1C980
MENLKGKSMDLTEDNLNKLKELFPEVFEEGKIDFDKLRLILGDEVDDNEERYEFTWHGKNNAIRIAQTPSTGTLRPDKESSKNWDDTENLYIEGDNLEVLKLLQKSYFGKVKMIYIDPPYNTGNDFVYKDNLRDNIDNYKRITNQTTRANPETNGRYHTDWLNMMYPRLKLARNLLRDDGVIFISISNEEVENCKKICNEVFGEENFRNCIIIRRGAKNLQSQFDRIDSLNSGYEYILMYSKLSSQKFKKISKTIDKELIGAWNNHWRGTDRPTMRYELFGITPKKGQWRWSKDRSYIAKNNYDNMILELNNSNPSQYEIDKWYMKQENKPDLLRLSKNNKPEHYIPPTNKQLLNDLWEDLKPNGSSYIFDLFSNKIFDSPKSLDLINRLIDLVDAKEDYILDFFSGSATTAHSVIQLNLENKSKNKFIMVQLPELTDEKSEAYKAGYKNICEIGKERIRRAGDKIVSENKDKEGIENLDIGFKVFKLDSSNLKSWDSSMDNLEQNLLDMVSNLKQDRTNEDLLYEILLKSGVELTAKIEEIKVGYNTLYNIGCGALLVCLDDKITQDVIDEIPKHKSPFMDTKVIFKEDGFMSDAAKINAVQNLKQFKIEDVRSV